MSKRCNADSVRIDFANICRIHGGRIVSRSVTDEVISKSKQYHQCMVLACNDERYRREAVEEGVSGVHPRESKLRADLSELAEKCGAVGVVFGGDPRGCTVKLVFRDGFTNDFAGEGVLVPTWDEA